ncbi:MAG: ABC transporter ATP-binding protein [Oscillospiraceae bacterium]
MIKATNLSKSFSDIKAIDCINATINSGSIFGLIGSNGAGKSTFIRMMAGVYMPDSGSITLDEDEIFENPQVKQRIFYISDEQYFFPNGTPLEMKNYYKMFYPKFDEARYQHLIKGFSLDDNRKIRTFSKGMKKQLSVIYAICSGADYIFCDETFDGLDPVARQGVKGLLANDVLDRNLTPILASHNLRELEDICDHVGLLHKGGILFSKDLDEMKLGIHKIQCVLPNNAIEDAFKDIDILSKEIRGSLVSITARGEQEDIKSKIRLANPIFLETLPLTLEEIFISETEASGYDIKKLIF